MKFEPTQLKDCFVLTPKIYGDERGFFTESYNEKFFHTHIGTKYYFVQDNHSKSIKGVLRGLHYQTNQVQGKLIRVVSGSIFDVAVDLRQNSPSFKKWFGIELSSENFKQLWVPPGFAHGFLVLSDFAEVLYKTTDFYDPKSEISLRFDDPDLGVSWPFLTEKIILSEKDQNGLNLDEVPYFK